MPLPHFFALAAVAIGIAAATARGRLHRLLAVLLGAAAFAAAAGMSVSQLGKVFGTGFGQTLNTLGLPALAAAMVATLAAQTGGAASLAARTAPWPARARTGALTALGLAAGTGASLGGSFAVLAPLRAAIAGRQQRRGAITLALALTAAQGLLLPSPVVIAGTAILAADWRIVLAIGLPAAVLAGAVGALAATPIAPDAGAQPEPAPAAGATAAGIGLAIACLLMATQLVVQSLGDIPSEPLGGGSARELILGIGRPLILLLAGTAIMGLTARGWRGGGLSETGWAATAIAQAAPLALLLGAAGGLQALTQSAHMAELMAEYALPLPWGLAVPFLASAILKALQGAALAAAITAAGMTLPLLAALGLDSDSGRALAVLAVGAGSVSLPHVNDPFFWLAADAAHLRPARALVQITCLSALVSAAAMVVLFSVRLVLA
jgi:GntP family gluconate:H+ symporter